MRYLDPIVCGKIASKAPRLRIRRPDAPARIRRQRRVSRTGWARDV